MVSLGEEKLCFFLFTFLTRDSWAGRFKGELFSGDEELLDLCKKILGLSYSYKELIALIRLIFKY